MTSSALELNRLLAGEIARRVQLLTDPNAPETELRAALHALKGSAAMAGHGELALVIGQFGHRLRQPTAGARAEARMLLEAALDRLSRGLPPFATAWPEPPPFLVASTIESKYRAEYHTAMHDRLGELDIVALASRDDPLVGLERAQRSVHAMKGAAAALGDEVTAWYCHGFEAALRAVPREAASAMNALLDLTRHRALFTLLLDDQARGLGTLRAMAQNQSPTSSAGAPPTGTVAPSRHPSGEYEAVAEAYLKVPVRSLDALTERLEHVGLVSDELLRTSEAARHLAARLREIGANFAEARRQLTTPGTNPDATGALARIEVASQKLRSGAASAARGADLFRRNAEFLQARTREMRSDLRSVRRTSLQGLFEHVTRAITRDADTEGKRIEVEVSGRDVPIDRRVAERLLDAVLQLARNAVAHGIETSELRLLKGKPELGKITLSAEQIGEWLRVTVADDGRGADVARIRELCVASGALSAEAARSSREDDLLTFLFLPGLTTHTRADLLAGRGLGLDLVQDTIRRLGGTIRLRSYAGSGLTATVEIPNDHAVVDVIWLEELGQRFALPVSFSGRIERVDPTQPPPVRLARCLGQPTVHRAALAIELRVYGVAPIQVGLDDVGEIEQVSLRALPELIAARGPYGGAVLQSDGSLCLAVDAPLIAARAWTLRHSDAT